MITKKVIEHYIFKLHLFITNVVKRKKKIQMNAIVNISIYRYLHFTLVTIMLLLWSDLF